MLQTLRRKQQYQVTNVSVEKIKLSRLLVQRNNEFKMNEIQRKTPQKKFKTILINSHCRLFLGLELTSYRQRYCKNGIQATDVSKRTYSPA